MTKQRKIFLVIGACTTVLCACTAAILWTGNRVSVSKRAGSGLLSKTPTARVHTKQTVQVAPEATVQVAPEATVQIAPEATVQIAPEALNSAAQQTLNELNTSDKASVTAFLAHTPGPLDNYLLNLEAMTNVANARDGAPDPAAWARALPIARVLEQGMCDCHQRNWLDQFITLGEAGLTGDLAKYHAQGEVVATIGRYNDDPVGQRTVTASGVQ